MPPLPSHIDLDALVRALKRVRAPASRVITKNDRLWGYSRRTPSQLGRDRAFEYIAICVKRLAKRLPSNSVTHLFQDDRDFGHCDSDVLPAAYFYAPRADTSPVLDWNRIAVSGAYEVRAVLGSLEKVIFPHHQCLSLLTRR